MSSCAIRPSCARLLSLALAAGSLATAAAPAHAILVLQTSSGAIVHQAGFNESSREILLGNLPAYSSTTYQYSTSNPQTPPLTNGAAVSTARFGMGVVSSPTFAGIGFATGTALTQRGNTSTSPATASEIIATFSATWENITSPYGTGLQAGGSFGFIGSLPSGGAAFVEISLLADFTLTVPGGGSASLRGPITPSPFYFRSTAGVFTFSRSDLLPALPTTIPVGALLTVSGELRIRVHNDGDEASVQLDGPGGIAGGDDPLGFIPTPGAAGLLGLGALFASRRRRA